MPNMDNQTIMLAFVAVTALAVLLQAIILLAIFFAVRKAANSLRDEVEELRSSVMPIIDTTRDVLTRIAPKIETTTADLADIAHGLRVQAAQMESSANEIIERVRRQSSRLDSMFTGVLDAVEKVGGFVAESVNKPMRQFSGILASIKAIVESLRTPQPASRPAPGSGPARRAEAPARSAGDEDMFV